MRVPGITLSNGHRLTYVIASGGLAYDGCGWFWDHPLRWSKMLNPELFTTFMKTMTLAPRQGNFRWWKPWGCIRFLPNGTVNAFGLTNPGLYALLPHLRKKITARQGVAASVLGEVDELTILTKECNKVDFVAIENNVSCPNTSREILRNREDVIRRAKVVKKVSRHPQVVKLSVAHDIPWIVERLTGLAEAISINSVPWAIAFPDKSSPLAHLGGGGVSGEAAQAANWKLVREIYRMTGIPVIGPSVWHYEDIDRLLDMGAKAVSFGALLMPHPYRPLNTLRPTRYVRRHLEENY